MFQGFSHFLRGFASFCIGQISHQQHKGFKLIAGLKKVIVMCLMEDLRMC